MDVSGNLLCLYTATVEERDGSYVVELPEQEVELGDITAGETYRLAVLGTDADVESDVDPEAETAKRDGRASSSRPDERSDTRGSPSPPVEVGEERTVDIEGLGEQGDGIARVERGYVVIVPDTEVNERVTVEIEKVTENVGFASVIEREAYYQ
ncbi:deoxyribonuclease [Haloprofundus marisrubri]|uniref:Deoxyribonuclease n=1 Tax=Haloprofundus marisrubri TaxID=1514971 RepID=A0A0W1RD14_9EURY|nr:TRAM domain-containing protein [Haloprofundus marisrubri]KTG11605.1 deoxyribonuclease [Haloprofundus marisrubri]